MKLYFAPLACSMASRIAFYEAGDAAEFIYVDTDDKRLEDGSDYRDINPMGQVPALVTDEGQLITENVAVLQYIADRHGGALIAPAPDSPDRPELHRWLNFIATEIHKATFIPLLDPHAPEGAKDYARSKTALRFGFLNGHLAGQDYLLKEFSVADAYLVTVLNWAGVTGVDLAQWPAIEAFRERVGKRPAVARAFTEEAEIWRLEVARKKAELAELID